MTRDPAVYVKSQVTDMLEFKNESPTELIEKYKKERHEQMLVVGGPHIGTAFLKEGLIDELWLTLEPKIFGAGDNLVSEEKLDINLSLISIEKVNKRGTLITKYNVLKNQSR